MHRRTLLSLGLLLLALALPLSASQFIRAPFDQVARESDLIIRGTVEQTWSAWDDAHEVIFTYANVRVTRYFGEATGPDLLVVREVGGTVGDYTQEAIGFPAIRRGEQVVLMLTKWENGGEYRINAFNQGKYLVRDRDGMEMLFEDPVKQGEARLAPGRFGMRELGAGDLMTIDEFAGMVEAARAGERVERPGPRSN